MVREEVVTDAACRTYFDTHPELFGTRTFEESKPYVERILKVHQVRLRLGITDPELDD